MRPVLYHWAILTCWEYILLSLSSTTYTKTHSKSPSFWNIWSKIFRSSHLQSSSGMVLDWYSFESENIRIWRPIKDDTLIRLKIQVNLKKNPLLFYRFCIMYQKIFDVLISTNIGLEICFVHGSGLKEWRFWNQSHFRLASCINKEHLATFSKFGSKQDLSRI